MDNGLAIIGYHEIPDLASAADAAAVLALVQEHLAGGSRSRDRNFAAQLTAFALRMRLNDIVALPLKTRRGLVALGRVSGPYRYQEVDGIKRHTRSVNWIRPDVPRSEFGQDLLNSLGAFMTVCRIHRNDSAPRIASILEGQEDPGTDATNAESDSSQNGDETVRDDQAVPDVADLAREQVVGRIRAHFTGHELTRLVDAVLQAQGYFTWPSTPGPDGGVDILAARGSLGFEGPRICVQVKATADPADVTILRSLQGTMQSFRADQGLLVCWGGFTSALEREARQSFFRVRLWNANNLVSAIYKTYENLPKQIQAEIPLERIWTLVRDDGEG
ncbi:MAG: restriction endonuclease [Chloroflexi bacterium]|nr:restriction endonuclease [Chloroflexota bacterium]